MIIRPIRLLSIALLALFLSVWCRSAAAAEPEVSNVVLQQRTDGSRLADIYFDLADAEDDILTVAVNISGDDGLTWHFPALDLSGDVGPGVLPGTGKHIVWDLSVGISPLVSSNIKVRIVASDAGVAHTNHSPRKYWIMEWSDQDWSGDKVIEQLAKGDVVVLDLYMLWNNSANEQLDVMGRIKALNPDIVILGYYLAKTSNLWWGNSSVGTITRTLYDRTLPYWSYTTEGDTLMDWTGQVVLNILDPDCRAAIATTLQEFQNATANPFDGVFWDYFGRQIWIAPRVADQVEGDPDMDGDGIPMAEDPDEIAAFHAAGDSLVLLVRDLMGDDYLQIFNGTRAYTDPEFAALGDGIYYEIFPTQVFPDPDMANALNPGYEFSLFNAVSWPRTDNGGPYIVLGMYWEASYTDTHGDFVQVNYGNINRVVGLLTDTYATWLGNDHHHYDWPEVEINLGQPLGPTIIDGDHFFREFQYGQVDMTLKSGEYPNPFKYTIKIGNQIVEELDIPYHYP